MQSDGPTVAQSIENDQDEALQGPNRHAKASPQASQADSCRSAGKRDHSKRFPVSDAGSSPAPFELVRPLLDVISTSDKGRESIDHELGN